MICDDGVDGAVLQTGPEGSLVLRASERRVDLVARIVAAVDNGVFVERQVMEGGVAGHVQPFVFRIADEGEGVPVGVLPLLLAVEVIPGISSGLAAPGAAATPLPPSSPLAAPTATMNITSPNRTA